jgi:hypothetical protein
LLLLAATLGVALSGCGMTAGSGDTEDSSEKRTF